MKIVFKQFANYKKKLALLILSMIGMVFTVMFWPKLMANLIDIAIPNKAIDEVFGTFGLMIVFVILGVLCGIATAKLSSQISMNIGRDLRKMVFDKVNNFSQQEIDEFTASSLITRTNSDIAQVQLFLNQCLAIALMAPFMCIFGIVMSVIQSPSLSVVLVIAVPAMAIIMVVFGKVCIPLSVKIQSRIDRINMIIREKLTGVRVIRAFGTVDFESRRFEEVNTDYMNLNKKLQRTLNAVSPALIAILAITASMVLYLAAANFVIDGVDYTLGEVMAIVEYVMQILSGVIMMTIVFLMLPRASTSAKRAQEVLQSENLIADAIKPEEDTGKKGYLEFKDVSFTYHGADTPALRHLSFSAKPGETTAIIGGTGSGKSTIVNLIPRLYDVSEGQVLVDGVDVRDYKLEELRQKIGFVPQKANLFSGTIDSNIAFGKEGATEEEIEEAVRTAQSYDFVSKKEDGFASHVAQGGTNFSGGQKQRLAIARAIVRKPEVYVFDDSFSALDFKTDKALRTALAKQTKNATTVIVAQRISTIMEADRIIVIDEGNIVGIGKHEELIKSCPVYREIAVSQLGKEAVE